MRWQIAFTDDFDEQQYTLIYNSLSATRKAHIDRMKCDQDRKNSLLASWLVDKLLNECGIKNATLENNIENAYYEENILCGLILTNIKDINILIPYLNKYINKLQQQYSVICVGDFNIAHNDLIIS